MGTITKRGELQWQAKVRRRGFAELYGVSRTTIYKVAPRRENEAGEAQPVKKKP